MKIKISPVVLLRIPAFSLTDQLTDVWDELKGAISHSSVSFYEKIKLLEVKDLDQLDPKTHFTIWKYFNRSQYRGVPYGSFAGFAVAELNVNSEGVVFSNEQHLHRFKDWSRSNQYKVDEVDLIAPDRLYLANSSAYLTSSTIRFLSFQDQVFELSEIEKSNFITELLSYCSKPVSYNDLRAFARTREIIDEVLIGILTAMNELQLIFTDLQPNITGQDYFERTGQTLKPTEEQYLIAERKVLSGAVPGQALQHLPSCINYLSEKLQYSENKDLMDFKKSLLKRFEGQEVSLMRALDPELGIGYGDLEGENSASSLISEIKGAGQQKEAPVFQVDSFAHELLLKFLQGKGDRKQVVQLEDAIRGPVTSKLKPANSCSALLRIADELLILDSLGGCTANALAGRFTLASEAVEQYCKHTAAAEAKANPNVIFFDLAYTAEGRVDNVNRRKSIYEHEVQVLNYSCSKNLVSLNDLMITVKNNELILLSRKYGKRVVPRLASAYNYSRSDLSVYRFLCDLQHQDIQSKLLFNVVSLLPGLDFYPRIQYKNIVLSPAKWRIRQSDTVGKSMENLLREMEVSRYFSIGNGDQTLCFDSHKNEDLLHLKQYLNQYNDSVISEVIIPNKQIFKDDKKKCYFTQIMVSLNHDEQLYKPQYPAALTKKKGPEKIIVPGKDWLYFEIYCHPQRSNSILTNQISSFISRHRLNLNSWFFIRYNDPAPHIRLRLQLKDKKAGYSYISKLMWMLDKELADGIITDVQLKTYQRECDRYGFKQIELTEQHFSRDSDYALEVLENEQDDFENYASCIALMKAALASLELTDRQRMAFVQEVQRSFEKEHLMSSLEFKRVNKEWQDFSAEYPLERMEDMLLRLPADLRKSFENTLNATVANRRPDLFCSLFHMHINRLFSNQQRSHELIIYSFLHKLMQCESKKVHYAVSISMRT